MDDYNGFDDPDDLLDPDQPTEVSSKSCASRYIIVYEHPDHGEIHASSPDDWGIDTIARGFWVDASGKVHPILDEMKYWIPPHKVSYVAYNSISTDPDQ